MPAELLVARRSARTTRVGSAVFALVGAGMVASTAITYVQTFPTPADRAQLAAVTSGSGLSTLFGPTDHIDTVGGYTFYKGYVTLSAIAAVWAVLITTRTLRGEEDAGRWALLLSGPIRPGRATLAALAGLAAPVTVLFLGIAAGTAAAGADQRVGFGLADAAVHGASIASIAAVFAAAAACTSQLAGTRRAASSAALGIVAVTFVLRMVGDAGASTRWVRWTTPFGWSEQVAPLTSNRVGPLLPSIAATTALAGAAVVMATRRDVGTGIVAGIDHAELRPGGLRTIVGFSLRSERSAVVAWLVGAAAMGAAFGVVAQIADGTAPAATRDLLSRFGVSGSFLRQYVGLVMLLVAAVLALIPASHIAAASREELEGRLTLLLAGPVRRSRWLAGRLAIAAGTLAAAAVAAGCAMWVAATAGGTDPGFTTVLGAAINVVPVCLVALGVGAMVFAVAPRFAASSVYLLVGWSLVADMVASLVPEVRWIGRLGLFRSLVLIPAEPAEPWTTLAVLAVALGLVASAVALFGHRDLQTA